MWNFCGKDEEKKKSGPPSDNSTMMNKDPDPRAGEQSAAVLKSTARLAFSSSVMWGEKEAAACESFHIHFCCYINIQMFVLISPQFSAHWDLQRDASSWKTETRGTRWYLWSAASSIAIGLWTLQTPGNSVGIELQCLPENIWHWLLVWSFIRLTCVEKWKKNHIFRSFCSFPSAPWMKEISLTQNIMIDE